MHPTQTKNTGKYFCIVTLCRGSPLYLNKLPKTEYRKMQRRYYVLFVSCESHQSFHEHFAMIRRSEYDVGQRVVLWLERLVQFVMTNQSKDLVTSNSQVQDPIPVNITKRI